MKKLLCTVVLACMPLTAFAADSGYCTDFNNEIAPMIAGVTQELQAMNHTNMGSQDRADFTPMLSAQEDKEAKNIIANMTQGASITPEKSQLLYSTAWNMAIVSINYLSDLSIPVNASFGQVFITVLRKYIEPLALKIVDPKWVSLALLCLDALTNQKFSPDETPIVASSKEDTLLVETILAHR